VRNVVVSTLHSDPQIPLGDRAAPIRVEDVDASMINAQGVEFIDENGGGCGRDPGKAKRKARKAHKRPCSKSNAMKLFRALVISALFVAAGALSHADPLPGVHYAPAENLEHIDVGLTDGAKHEIDFAAYALTDWPIMQALTRAADRGVKIRIYLDGTQFAEREPTNVFGFGAYPRR
jgi:hypothetical protein